MTIVRVALDVPVAKLFDYRASDATSADVGRRVLVPFKGKKSVGVVIEVGHSTTVPAERLKEVVRILRDSPPLAAEDLRLMRFAADYYHHPLGAAVMGALPGRLRRVAALPRQREKPREIPFTPLPKPLAECTVALVSTAAIARRDDKPFDQEHERRDPWWGDPSFRVIPLGTTERDVRIYHLHIDPRFGEADLDVLLPMRRLTELAQAGSVGRPARNHYSIMGYILEPTVLVEETAPAIAEAMRRDGVDAAALVPA